MHESVAIVFLFALCRDVETDLGEGIAERGGGNKNGVLGTLGAEQAGTAQLEAGEQCGDGISDIVGCEAGNGTIFTRFEPAAGVYFEVEQYGMRTCGGCQSLAEKPFGHARADEGARAFDDLMDDECDHLPLRRGQSVCARGFRRGTAGSCRAGGSAAGARKWWQLA